MRQQWCPGRFSSPPQKRPGNEAYLACSAATAIGQKKPAGGKVCRFKTVTDEEDVSLAGWSNYFWWYAKNNSVLKDAWFAGISNGLFKVRKSSYISSHCVIVRMPLPLTRCRNVRMVERPRTDVSDGISWYCPYCYTRKGIREKSFFAKSCLPLQKWVLLIYMWVRQYPITDASEEAEVGEHTAIDVYQWLREVCSQTLLNDPPIVLYRRSTDNSAN